MSLQEYFLRLEAYQVKRIDEQENIALQAWLNQTVQATKGSSKHPKPKYNSFEEFFDTTSYKNNVHKSFDPNYVALNVSKHESEQREQDEILERYRKRQEQKQKGQPN